ncbi:MAG: T9SS type A sorting domain-containing protein [Draconibacterium sp.]
MRAKSQTESNYSFLVAGHAYGAHAGTNIGLHPPLLEKLSEERDSSLLGLFLTGDIVNQSTTASWNKVETELAALGLQSFYVMGNHDNNTLGHQIFKQKHGGDYYAFEHGNDLFIVLNSTQSDRSISPAQLEFLDSTLKNTSTNWENAFIFFHEVIWNSHEKYKLVRSNSRSRYSQLKNISNFWTAVYPNLAALPEKKFFLFAGDVGGNPDAIAAFYDCWENVTLLSSGMGEVQDENYLKVNVSPDTVTFSLIPLNDNVEMHPVHWYNIPEKPDTIDGPVSVFPQQSDVEYKILPVWNATEYRWNLSAGITGNSDSTSIMLDFGEQFNAGEISVQAINDGFGESGPATLQVFADDTTFIAENKIDINFEVFQNRELIQISFNSIQVQQAQFRIYDLYGRAVYNERFQLNQGFETKTFRKNILWKGIFIAELRTGDRRTSRRIMLY